MPNNPPQFEPMPPLLVELKAALGEEAVDRLLRYAAGRHLYVPKYKIGKLRAAVGTDLAEWLQRNRGGECITVPLDAVARTRFIRSEVKRLWPKLNVNQIAGRLGIHVRTVRRHLDAKDKPLRPSKARC